MPEDPILFVHLQPNEKHTHSRRFSNPAFPLNEPGMIRFDLRSINGVEDKCSAIYESIKWLNVESSARYQPEKDKTYCNIYAYDLACCLGVFFPRVWWSKDAIAAIEDGAPAQMKYRENVFELNCNLLYDWFEIYASSCGWYKVYNIKELQEDVNKGNIGIAIGKNKDAGLPGHISLIIPEFKNFAAERDNDEVVSPLQSQAGVDNCGLFTSHNWWLNDQFKIFGFWVSDLSGI